MGDEAEPAFDDTVQSSESDPARRVTLATGSHVGRYRLEEVIGRGGMNIVYRATDTDLRRDVALKLIGHSGEGTPQDRLSEARAMAKVSHPSLVPVFDVGTFHEQLFIVMPLLRGGTLADWSRTRKRPWREVVDVFLRVGRGLAVAHAAGIIHRNVKPSNVLLDGTDVLVADLGIAEMQQPSPYSSEGAGTPGYMAPEQILGDSVDARADQYSYCVMFWEALYGTAPARNETTVARGRDGIPAWLSSTLERGFAESRNDRWASMDALLEHLEKRRSRAVRAWVLAGVAPLIATSIAAFFLLRGDAPATCAMPSSQLTAVWDANVRDQITRTFNAIDADAAKAVLPRLTAALDNYSSAWRLMHVDACRATHITHTETPKNLDRRMACLDRRLATLRTLTSTLAETRDIEMMRRADSLVESLPKIEECGDTKALMAIVAPPSDPAIRARVAELDRELDAITALKWRGKHAEQLKRAEAAVHAARATSDAPLLARALNSLAKAENDNGKDATSTFRELTRVAASAGMDNLAATAWLALLNTLTNAQTSFEEARTLEAAVHAAVVRAGSPDELRFQELYLGGGRAANSGEYKLARERFQAAIPLATTPDLRAELKSNIARVTLTIDGPSAALEDARAAVKEYEALFGPDNGLVADPLLFLAQVLRVKGDLEEARSTAERALAIQTRNVVLDSGDRAMTLQTLGGIEGELGDPARAIRRLEEAAAIFEKSGDSVRHALALDEIAKQFVRQGRFDKARPLHEQALDQVEKAMGREWLYYALLELSYAESMIDSGACREVHPLLEHAAQILKKEQPPRVAAIHWFQARCLLAANNGAAAVPELDRAEMLCRSGDCGVAPDVRWTLGRLLVERGIDPARGDSLIDDARAEWVSNGQARRVAEVDAWRSKRNSGGTRHGQ